MSFDESYSVECAGLDTDRVRLHPGFLSGRGDSRHDTRAYVCMAPHSISWTTCAMHVGPRVTLHVSPYTWAWP